MYQESYCSKFWFHINLNAIYKLFKTGTIKYSHCICQSIETFWFCMLVDLSRLQFHWSSQRDDFLLSFNYFSLFLPVRLLLCLNFISRQVNRDAIIRNSTIKMKQNLQLWNNKNLNMSEVTHFFPFKFLSICHRISALIALLLMYWLTISIKTYNL